MKTILTALAVLVLTIGVNAQHQEPLQEYQIDTTGTSNSMTIDAGFRIWIDAIYPYSDINSTGWIMEVQTYTYTDSTYSNQILNDSIPNRWVFSVDSSYVDSTFTSTMTHTVGSGLATKYGVGNIVRKR